MKIIEVGTGYTSIPANMGAATEIVVEELAKIFEKEKVNYEIFDIKDEIIIVIIILILKISLIYLKYLFIERMLNFLFLYGNLIIIYITNRKK